MADQTQQQPTTQSIQEKKQLVTKELQTRPAPPKPGVIEVLDRGLNLRNIDEMFRFAQAVWQSGTAPDSYKNEQAVLVAMVMGKEYGLPAMASIRGIAVIGGRPAMWGNLLLGVVQSSGKMDWIEEEIIGEGDERIAVCRTKRLDSERVVETRFSVNDAKVARLWLGMNKTKPERSPWFLSPERMLQFRARGFNLNDNFADVLSGCITAEEAMDIHEDRMGFDPDKAAGSKADELADELARPVDPNRRAEVVSEQAAAPVTITNLSGETLIEPARGETITLAPAHIDCGICGGSGKVYTPNTGKLIGECWECNGSGQVDPNETRTERELRAAEEEKDVQERDAKLVVGIDPGAGDESVAVVVDTLTGEVVSSDPTADAISTPEKSSTSSDDDDAIAAADEASGVEPNTIEVGEDGVVGIRYEKLCVRFATNQNVTMQEAGALVQKWLDSLSYSRDDLADDLRWVNVWAAARKIKPAVE